MPEKLKPITIVSASAGTGKTFRLAHDFNMSLDEGRGASCPTELIATTFTNRAADELKHRIRKFLLKDSKWSKAQSIFASYIGTVNSVCGRIVSDLSIEGGLSPSVKIIAEEEQQKVYSEAVDAMMNNYATEFQELITRMGKEDSWRGDVQQIADLARQNNLPAGNFREFAEDSWQRLKLFLPEPQAQTRQYELELKSELEKVIEALPFAGDTTKTTIDLKRELQEICIVWKSSGQIPWSTLVKLAKVKPGKLSRTAVERLTDLASEHFLEQTFQDDIRKFIEMSFACAGDCLSEYREFKASRGLLDFIDQEQLALQLFSSDEIGDILKGRFSKLFVDEFQDTSPIQLAVFLELARAVKQSTWVGDQKQSIFGFRGADPMLMQCVVNKLIPATGGSQQNLVRSFRSRPTLVSFVNQVFGSSMQSLGIEPKEIVISEAERIEDSTMRPALNLWWLSGSNQSLSIEALAAGVFALLSSPKEWQVESGAQRSAIKGSDIAILCRSNKCRLQIADALSRLGIVVATERAGLLKTPECILSLAVLRYLADRYDTLAIAEIVRFTDTTNDQQSWFYNWLEGGAEKILESNDALIQLDSLRQSLFGLSPVEALQTATTFPCVLKAIKKWGNQRQRFLNLEALIGLAVRYEESCSASRQTASNAGLVEFIGAGLQNDFQPANPDENAVNVLTYHKAKGLEWPMVIMYELDAPPSATPFDVPIVMQNKAFDPQIPLANRRIQYWPWPYGRQRVGTELAARVESSQEMSSARRQSKGENLRLLYVGMTRPRDYLVLACRAATGGTDWLDQVEDSSGASVFHLVPGSEGLVNILSDTPGMTAACTVITPDNSVAQARFNSAKGWFEPRKSDSPPMTDLPYGCTPSGLHLSEQTPQGSIVIEKRISLGGRLELSQPANMNLLGTALHAFLAVDELTLSRNHRLELANRIISMHRISALDPNKFLEASSRLWNCLEELYPESTWLREWPVRGRYGEQRTTGSIDLLLVLQEGYVIVDHKSYPGEFDSWEERALGHYPQLDAYSKLVAGATGKKIIGTYIHMPIAGTMLKLNSVSEWNCESSPPESNQSWLVI